MKNKRDMTNEELTDIVLLTDKRNKVVVELDNVNKNHIEINYYTNTSDILFDYYSILEHKDNNTLKTINNVHDSESHKITTTCSTNNINTITNNNTLSIIDFLKKDQINKDNTNLRDANSNISSNDTKNEIPITNNENETNSGDNKTLTTSNRALLLDQYLSFTDKDYINNDIQNKEAEKCNYCNSMNKIYCINDSLLYCMDCYTVEKVLTDNEKPSYKDPPKEISYFSYKRINHYTEFIVFVYDLLRTVGCSIYISFKI